MAKKKSVGSPTIAAEPAAQGAKRAAPSTPCPFCGAGIHPRSKTCPKCHKALPEKEAKPAGMARITKSQGQGVDVEKLALEFALFNASGDLNKAVRQVEQYKEDSLAQFIARAGGPEKAKQALEQLVARKEAK